MSEYHHYSFKIDGCLGVFSRAPSKEVAEERTRQLYPRSTIEYLGMDLPDSFRNGTGPSTQPRKEPVRHSSIATKLSTPPAEKHLEHLSETERSLVDAYAGH